MDPLPETDRSSPSPAPPVAPPTFVSDLKEVQHYGSLVLLFASIPALGLPGLVAKLLHVDEVLGLWQLIVATAPLTAAVAVVGIAILSGKYGTGELAFGAGVALLGSLFLGEVLGQQSPIRGVHLGNLPETIFKILVGYFRIYGVWSFATSFVVGGFLAWAWSKKFWPRLAPGLRKL
jgi:hypothetical protein